MATKRKSPVGRLPESPPTPRHQPTDAEARALDALNKRRAAAVPLPRLASRDGTVTVDHEDDRVGTMLLMQAFGAEKAAALEHLLTGLINFFDSEGRDIEKEINGIAATVAGIGPRDPIEMMLAAQMAITHELAMKTGRALHRSPMLPQQEVAERAFNKLTRTFTSQMEALRKNRNGGQQKVTVEHVTVNEGGQAIVGNVATRGEGGDGKTPR